MKCDEYECDWCQGVILKMTDDGRCIVARILHGGMMHKLGKWTLTFLSHHDASFAVCKAQAWYSQTSHICSLLVLSRG